MVLQIKSKIGTDKITIQISKTMIVDIDYNLDVSDTPKHIVNFMAGLLISEHIGWWGQDILFEELTEKELKCINEIVVINRICNPYGRVNMIKDLVIKSEKIVLEDLIDTIKNRYAICFGGGKDSIVLSQIAKELDMDIYAFMVGNQYGTTKIWKDVTSTATKYAEDTKIKMHIITTNFMKNPYKIIPWYIFGLPIMYKSKCHGVLYGAELPFITTFTGTNKLTRPSVSPVIFDILSRSQQFQIGTLTMPITGYGVQYLLSTRYKKYIKYQRSCMYDMSNCNKCPKCYGIEIYKRASSGNKGLPVNVKRVHTNNPLSYTIDIVERYLKGQKYDDWVFKANRPCLQLYDYGNELRSIYKEHFELYDTDPGSPGVGLELFPSRAVDWIKNGSYYKVLTSK